MDIFDPVHKSNTQVLSKILPEHSKYMITVSSPTTSLGDFGVIIRQQIPYENFILWYYVLLINKDYLLRTSIDADKFYLNFVLEGRITITFQSGQTVHLRRGQFQLLRVPAGNYDIFYPRGIYRYFQIEIRPDIIKQFFPGDGFAEVGKVHTRTPYPARYGNLSVNIPVGAWHRLDRIITNDQAGLKALLSIESAAMELMLVSLEQLQQDASSDPPLLKRQVELLEKAYAFVVSNLDISITVKLICDEVGISKSSLYTGFKKRYDVSIHEFILNQRIEKAKLLLEEDVPVGDVAGKVGFSNTSSFIRAFKSKIGVTPTAYRSHEGGKI